MARHRYDDSGPVKAGRVNHANMVPGRTTDGTTERVRGRFGRVVNNERGVSGTPRPLGRSRVPFPWRNRQSDRADRWELAGEPGAEQVAPARVPPGGGRTGPRSGSRWPGGVRGDQRSAAYRTYRDPRPGCGG